MQVHVVKSDLLELPVDAIVLPGNSSGVMAEGLALDLRRRAGESVEREIVECAPIAVGAAVVTAAGDLPARHVIHAPTVEEPGLKVSIEAVRRATRAALLATTANGFAVIAFPLMVLGPTELTIDETARAMVDELRAHRQPHPEAVYLVARGDGVAGAFEQALRSGQ
ncbi:MAG TPA: macro domain-containing protein [Polyangia bacterium]|jgi:O-acetyl-ADP-ribose deacetylase (regulator of RNase III)